MSSKKNNLKFAIVGATGMVGTAFLNLLQQRDYRPLEIRLFASDASAGKKIPYNDQLIPVQKLSEGCFDGLDIVFFSSGDEISKEWAPKAAKAGAFAIDNSAAFRMDPDTHLVVPEVNGDLLKGLKPQIIANPNCSTIQLVVVMDILQKHFGVNTIKVSSYQAVSGAGLAAQEELLNHTKSFMQGESLPAKEFVHPIVFNCIPQIGSFADNGFTSEENKIMQETRKILRLPKVKVSAFTVRVPVLNSHAETVWVSLDKNVSRDQITSVLKSAAGVIVQDDPKKSVYPMQNEVSGKDPVYVGRIHQDIDDPMTWLMWIVSDNIKKGAALNGLQIAEQIFDIN